VPEPQDNRRVNQNEIEIFVQAAAASVAAVYFAGAAKADGAGLQAEAGAVPDRVYQKPCGEPYSLMGRRLVFTNWPLLRPGHIAWLDEQANTVTVVVFSTEKRPHLVLFREDSMLGTPSPRGDHGRV
jgi:hypothetical protein